MKAFPKNPECQFMNTELQWQQRQFDSVAAAIVDIDARLTDPVVRSQFLLASAQFARLRGKLDQATRLVNESHDMIARTGLTAPALDRAAAIAFDLAWFRGDVPGAQRLLDSALAHTPLRSVPASEAPYTEVALAYAAAGRPDRTRSVMAEWEVRRVEFPTTRDSVLAARMRGAAALAEGNYAAAQTDLRVTEHQGCRVCDLPMLGRAYDLAGAPDSAIAVYTRFIDTPSLDRIPPDGAFLPVVHKRLGELYEAKGQRDKALEHYRAFIALWKDADPVLQPKVTDARQRVAALTRGTDARKQ
jgi:tetratricopeptide (TPR) repeat protein